MAGILPNRSAEEESAVLFQDDNFTTSLNSTTGPRGSYNLPVGLLVIFGLLSVFIVLTNGSVFMLFILRRRLRTATNYMLLGLGLADFLNGAFNIPFLLALLYNLMEDNETTRLLNNSFHSFTALASIYHIFVVTWEKYFAVMRPFMRHQVTKQRVILLIALLWCMSGLFSFIQFAWRMDTPYAQIIYTTFLLIAALLLPYPFLLFAFIKMFLKITRRTVELQKGEHSANSKVIRKNYSERKCVIVFSLMALVYALCWFPYYIITLMCSVNTYFCPSMKVLEVIITIRYVTSLFNPIMYTLFKGDFNMALKSLKWWKSQRNTQDTSETHLQDLRSRTSTQ